MQSHIAARAAVGTSLLRVLDRQGLKHTLLSSDGTTTTTYAIGAACSQIFGAANLARLLGPGLAYEQRSLAAHADGKPAAPLSCHTSIGIPVEYDAFVAALAPHLPWPTAGTDDDWFVNLQVEGASAVWAGVDVLLQLQAVRSGGRGRTLVGVGAKSYHGPGVSSFGSKAPLGGRLKPSCQVPYPAPVPSHRNHGESNDAFHDRIRSEFANFLDTHGDDLGVLLVEPQWGSSVVGLPWDATLLRDVVSMAKRKGVLVLCDEIMCGLGRHGKGEAFLSGAWHLEPDAVTFGKAVAAGAHPLSGCAVRAGRRELAAAGAHVLQSHTYAAASPRALMAATSVLEELPRWHEHIAASGELCVEIFEAVRAAGRGALRVQGLGLMRGVALTSTDADTLAKSTEALKSACDIRGVTPYWVTGGLMVTPPLDVGKEELMEAGRRLVLAVEDTVASGGFGGDDIATAAEAEPRVERFKGPAETEVEGAAEAEPRAERFKGPAEADMDDDQRRVRAAIAGTRTTGLRGPFGPWLANPALAEPAQALGRVCRYETSLPLRESELVILLTATSARCPTEWAIHVAEARRGGLEEEVIAAIEASQRPLPLAAPRDVALAAFAAAVLDGKGRVDDATYALAKGELGEKGLVEVTSIIGYYQYVALTLNVFEIQP